MPRILFRDRPLVSRRRAAVWFILSVIVFPADTGAQRLTPEAARLQAAFLLKFPQFVEWPPAVLTARKTIDICVARPNPFEGALRELVKGESVGARALVVRDVGPPDALDTCHVLFMSASTPDAGRLLERVKGRPVLTVGEADGFLDDGGIIRLRFLDRRLRFDINGAAADRGSLRLSSQLLELAVVVRGRP